MCENIVGLQAGRDAMTGRSNPLIQPDNSKGGTEMDRMLTIIAVVVAVIGALTAMAAVLTAAVRI